MFVNGEIWEELEPCWQPFKQKELREVFTNPDSVKGYAITFGIDCIFTPTGDRTIWGCTCGAINMTSESV